VPKKLSLLDQPNKCSALDPREMRGLIESFPKQFNAAADMALAIRIPAAKNARSLVVAGLGGSAIGGDVVRSVLGRSLRVPMLVNRDYRLPGFADSKSIVFACSYSGNTEETLSAYHEALEIHAEIVCITSGGRLAKRAKADRKALISLPGGMPPRAALGYSALALLGCIQALGLIDDTRRDLEETAALISRLADRYRLEVPLKQNPAKKMASALFGRIAAVYGGSGLLDCAAARWRSQIEENAKNLALHHVLPEMNHNEILGWECPAVLLRRLGVVLLRDTGDHPQVQKRFDLTKQILAKAAGNVQVVWSEGQSALARAFSVIYLGDFISLYLAYLNRVDPTRIDKIDYLKHKLGS